jgi:hypothetical protein
LTYHPPLFITSLFIFHVFLAQGPEESPLIFEALELFISAICLQLWLLLGSAFGFSLLFSRLFGSSGSFSSPRR